MLYFLQVTDPVEATEKLFGYMMGFLTTTGIMPYFVGSIMAWIVIGLTVRAIEALGGGSK